MKSHLQAAVIGGGVVGASVLYHLTKAGWKDVALFERSELTSGSTWHAAGGMHTLNGDPDVSALQRYTIDLYREIEDISGQSCGVHLTGGIILADTLDRMDWLKTARAIGRHMNLDTELVTPQEAQELFPLIDPACFVGGLYDPVEGHVDPSGVTQAYAKSARIGGAEIYLHTKVEDLQPRPDGSWDIVTEKGTIHAEHVVNAGGLWAREVGRMVGVELPVLAMEHMYLLTDEIPEVTAFNESTGRQMMHALDFGGEIYTRQEGKGMLIGTYEQAGKPWSPKTTPWDFGHELLQPDLDRIAPSLEIGFKHFPPYGRAGIRQIVNGPFTFAPDGNPLVGPVRGLRNFWCACAVMAGFSQGGGVGLTLANWMTEGDPGFDVFGMDVARYGDWATLAYTNAKVRENYSRRFNVPFPNEELPAGRPLRTTPLYDRFKARGAVFGEAYGLEYPLWFADEGELAEDIVSFRRSNDFANVGREAAAVRNGVGLYETSGFAKYSVTGPGAEIWLSRILANRTPREGRLILSPMLNPKGKLIGDFTLAKTGAETFYMVGSGPAEKYHMRWFEEHLPEDGSVAVRALGLDRVGLMIAGPASRDLLQAVTDADVSAEAFRFLDIRAMDIGPAPALVGRISYTGDLGYEIWMAPEYQIAVYDLLMEAGAPLGLKPFGLRALDSLRLEKSFGAWAFEYRPIYGPYEAGLDRFVDLAKNDFIGRDAAVREKEEGGALRLVAMVVDVTDADSFRDEPIWHDGAVVGRVTSGGYAHVAQQSMALGYLPRTVAEKPGRLEIEILGERCPARILEQPLFDPDGARMRG